MQHFTSVHDVDDPLGLLAAAKAMKAQPFEHQHVGKNRTVGMIFFNPSLRTRMSTEKAATMLGMSVISLDTSDGWNMEFETGAVMNGDKAEHVQEAAAVMSQYCDVLAIRSFPTLTDRERDYQDYVISKFRQYAHVPVLSLEGAIRHPLQSLADWLTIETMKKTARPKVVLTWAPHPKALPQAVPNSFVEWMKVADYDLVITHPEGYELSQTFTQGVTIEHDQRRALEGADFVYAKNWSSYHDYGKILTMDSRWMVTPEHMAWTNDAKFMHCLPVRRNQIVTDAVLDSPNSIVIEQANNRTFAAMAVLESLIAG
jgi:N-succinyl-L-ornithine transcarbamylase